MSDARMIMEVGEGTDEDRKYESAVNAVLHMSKKDYPSYVGGLAVASGHDFPVWSPIDETIIFGSFQEPEDGLTDRAVEVAKNAFATWSKTSPEERVEIFDRALENIILQKYKLAGMATVCCGMTRDEALDEVERLIEVIDNACQDVSEGVKGKPEGVWAILTEYNSPFASPIGYCAAAILAGNTVVIMPSKYAPVPVYYIYDILVQAGLPDGVMNIIVDRFDASSASLANNLDAIGVVAAGSGDRLEDLIFLQADDELRFVNELKGMNPIFVYKPASMKDAAKKVVRSAFAFAGQRVDSCSKVIVTMDEQKALTSAILEEVKNIKVDDPAEAGTVMGPIMTKPQFELFEKIVKKYSDYLVYGGKRIVNEITEGGYYVTPAVFMGVPEEDDLNNIDNALPILVIRIVENEDEAIDEVNYTEYGLSAGIITKEEAVADRFIREVNADEVFVNDPSVVIGPACKAKVRNFLA